MLRRNVIKYCLLEGIFMLIKIIVYFQNYSLNIDWLIVSQPLNRVFMFIKNCSSKPFTYILKHS